MMKPIFKKIIWAVDTMEPVEFQTNAQSILGALAREMDAEIYPVHIYSYLMPNSDPASNYEQAYLALSEKRLAELKDSDVPQMKAGKVLIERDATVRAAVNRLLSYSEEEGADGIVVATHSHGIVTKFFLGSFAETLLLQSDIPVITVNPKTKVREKISKVLFPTPFYEKFRAGFEKTLELCAALGSSLTVLYKEPFIPMLDGSPELFRWLNEEADRRKREADRYRDLAEVRNVPIEVRIDSRPGNVADEISSYAKAHNCDLIAMVSQTSQFEGPRVGSVCRKVVRTAPCPVWTFKTDDYVKGEID